jgi:hypothetical protein
LNYTYGQLQSSERASEAKGCVTMGITIGISLDGTAKMSQDERGEKKTLRVTKENEKGVVVVVERVRIAS